MYSMILLCVAKFCYEDHQFCSQTFDFIVFGFGLLRLTRKNVLTPLLVCPIEVL